MLSAKLFDSRIHSQNVTGKEKRLGYSVGAKSRELYRIALKFTLIFTFSLSTVLTLICCLFTGQIVSVFLTDAAAYDCGVSFARILLCPHSPLHQLPVWRILCADQRAANTRRGNGIPNRQYLPSGAYLHSGYVHPRRDLSRNRTVPGAACGGSTFSAAGVLLYMRSSKRLLNNQ